MRSNRVAWLATFVATIVALGATTATAAQITLPGTPFSEASGFLPFTRFDPGLGTLTGVAVRLSDLSLSQEVLVDYDDTDTYGFSPFTLSRNVSFGLGAYVPAVGAPPSIAPTLIGITSPASTASATVAIVAADDGDGSGVHNGGSDESTHRLDFTTNDAVFADHSQEARDLFTGLGTVMIDVYPGLSGGLAYGSMSGSPSNGLIPVTLFYPQIETAILSESSSGTVSVTYTYAVPEPAPILLVASALIVVAATRRGPIAHRA